MATTASQTIAAPPGDAPQSRGNGARRTAISLPLMVTVFVICLIFAPTLLQLARLWNIDPNYSHGPIVLLAAALFAWMSFSEHRTAAASSRVTPREVSRGFGLVALGLVLHFAAWLANQVFVDVFSLVLVSWGCCFVFGGGAAWRKYAFATAFLLFMAPLPPLILSQATIALQQLVAAASTTILEIAGTAVYREGYLIHLNGFTMEVGQACSGMRQIVAFAAAGAAVGHLSRRGGWFSITCVGLAIGSAVVANLLRVLLTAAVLAVAGPVYASGVFHTLEGLLTFLIGIAMLLAGCLGLARWLDLRTRREAAA